jgi:hypothetical protein
VYPEEQKVLNSLVAQVKDLKQKRRNATYVDDEASKYLQQLAGTFSSKMRRTILRSIHSAEASQKKQLRTLRADARKAARAIKASANEAFYSSMQAGKIVVAVQDYLVAEHASEHMEDQAEDLADSAEDDVERLFESIERKVEEGFSKHRQQAQDAAEEKRKEVRKADEEKRQEARKANEAKREEAHKTAEAKDTEQTDAKDTAQSAPQDQDKHAQPKASNLASLQPLADLRMLACAAFIAASSVMLGLALRRSRKATVDNTVDNSYEPPLLSA